MAVKNVTPMVKDGGKYRAARAGDHLSDEDGGILQPINTYKQYRSIAESDTVGATVLGHNVIAMPDNVTTTVAFAFHVPAGWDSGTNPKVHVVGITQGAASGNYRLEYGMESAGKNEVVDGVDDQTITHSETAPAAADTLAFTTAQELDRTKIESNDHILITFRRLGLDALDTRSGDLRLSHLMIIWPMEGVDHTS